MTSRLVELHNLCLENADVPLANRLQTIAESLSGTNYGPWPDGSSFESMDDFSYTINTLDCVTYVEVVLALAKTKPCKEFDEFKQEFENLLRLIHYANGQTNFASRNHFMSIDWILNNKFMVEDITMSLCKTPKIAEALIDKLTWAKRHKINKDALSDIPENVVQKFKPQVSRVPYIETTDFLDNYNNYIDLFPEYCIVNIVRPNWDLTEQIGTHLNISHLGFVFKDLQTRMLKFWHSTIIEKQVTKEPLDEYMKRHKDSPTIRGLNVLVISPGYHNAR